MEPLKERINRETVRTLATALAAQDPALDAPRFVTKTARGLAPLELKARIEHVADALFDWLGGDFPAVMHKLRGSLPRPVPPGEAGLFRYWPVATVVERHGRGHRDEAFEAMRDITRYFSCEFAIRPYLAQDLDDGLARLRAWTQDPDERVRRLCSEGCRPRLPWGQKLRALVEDPGQTFEILHALVDDPSLFVRRSVANHLGDVAKDKPDLAFDLAETWLAHPSEDRAWVVRHGLRHPVKQGAPRALALLGYARPAVRVDAFAASPRRVRIGDKTTLKLRLTSTSTREQALVVDYAVHFRKKTGTSAKVFKWSALTLGPGEEVALTKSHSFVDRSTRTHLPGAHRIEIQVNGEVAAHCDVNLIAPR